MRRQFYWRFGRIMNKRKLLELKFPEMTKEIIELAEKDVPQKDTYWNTYVYQYGLYLRARKEDGYLIVSIFFADRIRAGAYKPEYVLFVNKEKDKFITYNMGLERWSNAKLQNLEWPKYCCASEKYIGPEDEMLIQEYFGTQQGGYSELDSFQQGVRLRALIERDRKLTDSWDEDMKQVRDVPKDWEQWVAKTGIQEHYLFYQYKKGGAKTGFCSHCRKFVPIEDPKYNKRTTCSHCGYPVMYKSIGKFGCIYTEWYNVYLLQRCKDGVILRQFNALAKYRSESYQEPEILAHEVQRIIYDRNSKDRKYYRGMFKQREYRWIAGEMETGFYFYMAEKGKVYPRTLPDLDKRELSRTGLCQMIHNCNQINPRYYMAGLKQFPVLEKIVKAGLYKLAVDIYERGKEPECKAEKGPLKKILGLDQQRLKRLRNLNGGIEILEWLQAEKRKDTVLSDEIIAWFIQNNCKPNDFIFIEDRMSYQQIKNYLLRQKKTESDSIKQIVTTWEDYLSMAARLKMDTYDAIVYRTSKLYQRHKEVIEQIELKNLSLTAGELEKEYKNISQILPKLQEKYSYQNDEYMIIAPNSVLEILDEGRKLHHCIDKKREYFERIDTQETYVLFLRKASEPEQAYYTLEIEPGGVIRQKRTEYDRQNKDIKKAEMFLREWQEEIQKNMTEEDLILATRSRHMRKKRYAQLREKKVYIHGGLFQGKLLADVLEKDLMEMTQTDVMAA